jgi:hypothetical protein
MLRTVRPSERPDDGSGDRGGHRQGGGAVVVASLEVVPGHGHGVGDVGQADDIPAAGLAADGAGEDDGEVVVVDRSVDGGEGRVGVSPVSAPATPRFVAMPRSVVQARWRAGGGPGRPVRR